ncbi:MAG TPA: MobF family relaxase [Solirubrobacteraceae bacterium]|nr:MobF family relaxase [Solirubrobacteraceae bacterium]
MQSTHKIAGKDAGPYSAYLTSENGHVDYYVDPEDETGDSPRSEKSNGTWHGNPNALASLGLTPGAHVQRDQLLALMNGQAPGDGREIRQAGGNGTRVAGIDATFSAPKTISALWAAASGEDRERIERAHNQAVASTLTHVEQHVELVRNRAVGQLKWQTANSLVAAKFTHTSSRLTRDAKNGVPDPQLHTHVVILAAERHDGRFAAVDSRQLFLSARENGAWYRAELAHNLQREGLQVERGTGKDSRYFELTGVPASLAEHWSSRSQQIQRAARDFKDRYGRDPKAGELKDLTTSTRGEKATLPGAQIDANWKTLAAEHGLTPDAARDLFAGQDRTTVPDTKQLAREILDRVTQHSSTVSDRELRAIAYERATGIAQSAQAHQLLATLERTGQLIALQNGLWTTRELREREQQTVTTIAQRAREHAAPVDPASLAQAEREIAREIGNPLSQEQRQALHTITGPGGVTALIGQAGTGKGVVLHSATHAWQQDGYQVIGTAIAGATAERLAADAKTDQSLTTDSLLARIEHGSINLDKNTVVVMDEAGMADTNRLSGLVQQTSIKEAKLVLAGDAAQLSPIGAGGLFAQATENAPTSELTEIHRAQNSWEREAWQQLRAGNATHALAQYDAHGQLHITDTREQATERMLADWNEQRLQKPEGRTVMITDASNQELDRINTQAQQLRDRAGELGNDRANLPGAPYQLAAGDQIIFTKPLHQPAGQPRVENGTLGTVKDVLDNNTLTVDTHGAHQREITLNTHEHKDLKLGYAQHVYKAQGLTADKSLALIGGWQTDRERSYVALTRGRESTNIYTSRENLGHQGLNEQAIERLADRIAQTNAQQASIAHDTLHDRALTTDTPGHQPESAPEQQHGVGAASHTGPDPSRTHTPETSRDNNPEHQYASPEAEQASDPHLEHGIDMT